MRYHLSSLSFCKLSLVFCSDLSLFDDKHIGYTINSNLVGISLRRTAISGVITSTPYNTGNNNWVCSAVFNPAGCRGWNSIDVDAYIPAGTSINYRLSLDGITHYIWDGSDWIESDDSWNTLDEIREGFSLWQYSDEVDGPLDKRIAVVANLVSGDGSKTPIIRSVNIVWNISSEYNVYEDVIFDSIIPRLQSLSIFKDWATSIIADGTDNIVVPDLGKYSIVSIESVFDHTTDQKHDVNIFDHYDANTNTLYFVRDVDEGNIIWILYTYHPVVHIATSLDYDIVEPPAIIIESIRPIDRYMNSVKTTIRKDGVNAIVFNISTQVSFSFRCNLMMSKVRDVTRLISGISRDFRSTPYIESSVLDEKFDLRYVDSYEGPSGSAFSEVAEGTISFDILNIPMWDDEPTEGKIVIEQFSPDFYRKED